MASRETAICKVNMFITKYMMTVWLTDRLTDWLTDLLNNSLANMLSGIIIVEWLYGN